MGIRGERRGSDTLEIGKVIEVALKQWFFISFYAIPPYMIVKSLPLYRTKIYKLKF